MPPSESEALWASVDRYLNDTLIPPDPALEAALAANAAANLPAIDVSPSQGKLLQLLAETQRAHRILEIGTLGGYSTINLARALPPNGKLITLELDPASRRSRARQHRPRRPRARRRTPPRSGTRLPRSTSRRARRALRPHLPRRQQRRLPGLPRRGPQARPPRHPHPRRQRHPRR